MREWFSTEGRCCGFPLTRGTSRWISKRECGIIRMRALAGSPKWSDQGHQDIFGLAEKCSVLFRHRRNNPGGGSRRQRISNNRSLGGIPSQFAPGIPRSALTPGDSFPLDSAKRWGLKPTLNQRRLMSSFHANPGVLLDSGMIE